MIHGKQLSFYENGQISSVSHYEEGKIVGESFSYFEDGKTLKAKMTFARNKRNGPYIEYDTKGNVIEKGAYLNNRKDGVWTEYYNQVLQDSGRYENDKKEGAWVSYYNNRVIKERLNYRLGQRTGDQIFYSEEGKKKYIEQYKDGSPIYKKRYYSNGNIDEEGPLSLSSYRLKKVGKWTKYYWSGGVERVDHWNDQGESHGDQLQYNKQGKLVLKLLFENDHVQYRTRYNPATGHKLFEGGYTKKGNKDGIWIFYDEAGSKASEKVFTNEAKKIEIRYFEPDGTLTRSEQWENNLLNGEYKTYDEQGNVLSIDTYANGELVETAE